MYAHKSIREFALIASALLIFSTTVLAVDNQVLKREMTGPEVKELQQMLDSLGYHIPVDGRFGSRTENAIRTFQQDSGLLADGVVGAETIQALKALGENRVHKVIRGDSLILLAKKYATTVADIMDANDLTDDTIYIGQKLVIPAKSFQNNVGAEERQESAGSPVMMTYQVQPGESTYVIAKRFHTSVPAIAEANNLIDPSRLQVGQKLLVPTPQGSGEPEPFVWPVVGRITSGYGWRVHPIYKNRQFHGGLDIAVGTGTKIVAAASGKVIRAENMDGFGLGIVIDHGEGVTSWYGHNSKLLVKKGETVVTGQVIARSGNTGVSTGPHLDFRIKVDGNAVNPLTWLPDRKKLM